LKRALTGESKRRRSLGETTATRWGRVEKGGDARAIGRRRSTKTRGDAQFPRKGGSAACIRLTRKKEGAVQVRGCYELPARIDLVAHKRKKLSERRRGVGGNRDFAAAEECLSVLFHEGVYLTGT